MMSVRAAKQLEHTASILRVVVTSRGTRTAFPTVLVGGSVGRACRRASEPAPLVYMPPPGGPDFSHVELQHLDVAVPFKLAPNRYDFCGVPVCCARYTEDDVRDALVLSWFDPREMFSPAHIRQASKWLFFDGSAPYEDELLVNPGQHDVVFDFLR